MQPAEPGEFGLLQARDGAKNALLFTVLQLGLEADHVPQRAERVVLTQLDHGIRPAALRMFGRGPVRIVQPDRLHRPEPQRFHAAFRHDLDRHAAVEIGGVRLPFLELALFARQDFLAEGQILVLGHRAVDVVAPVTAQRQRGLGPLVPARGHPGHVHVDRIAIDDRGDGIEEGQALGTGGRADRLGQGLGGERSGGDDGQPGGRQAVNPLARQGQAGLRRQRRLDLGREHLAIDRQRRSGRHAGLFRSRHDQRTALAHLVMEQANRVLFVIVRAQRVRADQLGQPIGLVRGGALPALVGGGAAHLRQAHPPPAPRELPGRLGAGETAADDMDVVGHGGALACQPDPCQPNRR